MGFLYGKIAADAPYTPPRPISFFSHCVFDKQKGALNGAPFCVVLLETAAKR